jgi:NADH-quinone oxidoreductase subunit M
MTPSYGLSLLIFLPLLGGVPVLAAHRRPQASRWIALAVSCLNLALIVALAWQGPAPQPGTVGTWWLTEERPWIGTLGIEFDLGLDGISLVLILLTAFLVSLSILISWKQIKDKVASFHFSLLLMESSVIGLFLARDLFLFYLFWEVQIIPVFLLVGIWGHENRIRAALKFLSYTIAGSLFMLLAMVTLYLWHGDRVGVYTFSIGQLMGTPISPAEETWLFAAFVLAMAIKIPLVPVHMWLPDAHTEAPIAGSVVLAGILLKTGTYGLLRIAIPLFPLAARAAGPFLLLLGLVGLFYTAWVAFAQKDIKRMVAYSSIAHMGLVVIGLMVWNVLTLNGALLQMVNHGLSTSALFMMVGMLNERIATRQLADLGGLWKRMPVFGAFFLLFAMSAMGIPGLNNFVGEILILIGTFQAHPVVAVLGFTGMVFTLVYVLRMVQETLLGPSREEHDLWDVTPREILILGVLAAAVVFIGLFPQPVLNILDAPVRNLVEQTASLAAMR